MAKRKTAVRKTRHSAGGDSHPYRGGNSSKHASASPSLASSPSPQPQDLVQRRRKGTPFRSPSHGDTSKGIVFAFRIKKDADLSMAVDILSYDQVPEEGSATKTAASNSNDNDAEAVTSMAMVAVSSESCGLHENHTNNVRTESTMTSTHLRVAGEQWSSDPTSYPSNNVMDLTRNMLILHSRKPHDFTSSPLASSPSSPLFHPYRRSSTASRSSSSSQPSTPPLSDSGSSSSASSSPSSPSLCSEPLNSSIGSEKDLCVLDAFPPSPFDAMRSQPARMLSVRGLGAGTRRMQVYL
ncbi:hypothetical protein BCR41DRAFT_356093, partial [Lobosporangium transversale]